MSAYVATIKKNVAVNRIIIVVAILRGIRLHAKQLVVGTIVYVDQDLERIAERMNTRGCVNLAGAKRVDTCGCVR